MKIGIDASRLRAGMTGVGRYTEGILHPLNTAMPEAEFILYARQECSVALPSDRWSVRCDTHPIWSRLPLTYWIHYRLGLIAKLDDLDVLWTPNTLVPRDFRKIAPCVTTVCDFNHILVPETLPPITRRAHLKWFDEDVKAASRVVAISEGTSVRMHKLLGRKADAIAFPAVPLLPPVCDRSSASSALAAIGVKVPFFLTVGTRAPRKNLVSAIGAIALMKARGELVNHQLVMAGGDAWDKKNRFSESQAGLEWIKPLGYVDDATLAALYSLADALIFPSLYEGFGMPVFEARAMGCRVVTTDSPELREAGGLDATYVEPTPEGIAAGLVSALSRNPPEACRLEHEWKDAAEVMAGVFSKTMTSSRD